MKPTITHYLSIAFGGALGSVTRVALAGVFPANFLNIPLQILLINILGCFVMGFLVETLAWHSIPDNFRYFLISGFLGGFTTFSAFALEFGLLFQKQLYFSAVSYVILSVLLSIIAFFLGKSISI